VEEPIRVGLIGCGQMGLWHARSLADDVRRAELAAVADPDEAAARRAADLAPGVRWSTGPEALLSDPSIQAVVIASSDEAHAGLIAMAAQAGKHVFCEKPLAPDLAGADAALAAVARHGVKLQVGFQRRFDPAYQRAREVIAGGELGPVELAVATTRDPLEPGRPEGLEDAAIFTQTTIHDLDSLRYLTGLEAVQVYATASWFSGGAAEELEVDTVAVVLRFQTGALATITNCRRAVYGYDVRVEVMGPKGKVEVGQEEQIRLRRFTAQGVCHDHVYWYVDRFGEAYRRELQHFVDCVAEDRTPAVGGADGRAAQVLAEAAARSLREGRPVDVPVPG
jgi:myo-inositol 2-dehydrogenase/D-chiro-inositol 1-dehydrogenase